MMNAKQYEESLRRLKLQVYLFGRRVENVVDDPIIRPSMNAVAATYELAHQPEYEDLMTAKSHLTGRKINRFTHIHQNNEDLVKKSKMGRMLGAHTACCFQRCVGMDAMNALSIVTYDIDAKYGTKYNERFLNFLRHVQDDDLTCDGAMTDPKGDRGLAPQQQADPDLYLHVVEERPDGIVVSGAKAHQTGAVNSHEIIVMPTVAMRAGGPGLRRLVRRAERHQGNHLHHRTAVLRHKEARGKARLDRRQRLFRRPRGPGGLRPGVRPLGEGLHVQGIRVFRRRSWRSSPPTTARATPAKWAWATS